jgi:hypothetical protein
MNHHSFESIETLISRTGSEEDSVIVSSEDEFFYDEDSSTVPENLREKHAQLLRHPSLIGSFDPDILSYPAPLDLNTWDETPSSHQFRVRSKTYMENQEKNPSNPHSLFRLIAVDLLEVETPIYAGVCTLPNERVQQWLRRQESNNKSVERDSTVETPEFILCINICVPGPPILHLVMYYAVEDSTLIGLPSSDPSRDSSSTELSPFTRLASKFFFGPSDDFRDRTFKLVPRITQGNIIVRRAVGSKPTIIGRRIKQIYVRGDKFFEIIIDVTSKTTAAAIIQLARGYVSLPTIYWPILHHLHILSKLETDRTFLFVHSRSH